MANPVHLQPGVCNGVDDVSLQKPTVEQFAVYRRAIEAEFSAILSEVSPKTDGGQPLLLAEGQERNLSVTQHKALLAEETNLLAQRLSAAKKVVDACALLQRCERQVVDAKAALLGQYISSINDLQGFRKDWQDLRDRVANGYHCDMVNEEEGNGVVGAVIAVNQFAPALAPNSQETSRASRLNGAHCDMLDQGSTFSGQCPDGASKTNCDEKRLPRLEELPLVSNFGQQLIRHRKGTEQQSSASSVTKDIGITSATQMLKPKPAFTMETTYTVKAEANDRSTPSPSQISVFAEKPKSEGSSSMDGSFVNTGLDQATLLRNMEPMNDKMPQPDFDDSVTIRSFGDNHTETITSVRPKPPKLISTGLLSPAQPSYEESGSVSSSSKRPTMPAFNQRTVYGGPVMPVFRAAHVWNKGEQLADKRNDSKPSIGQSSAFKPVADGESAKEGKRKGLPTPLRQYHRRSRSLVHDPAIDASYIVASDSQKENTDNQQRQSTLRVALFTAREYDSLSATVRCQLELVDLNAGVAALNNFMEANDATVFSRKTLQKAVSSCLDSKQAMFFTNALSEASKLSRINVANNQTVFSSGQ